MDIQTKIQDPVAYVFRPITLVTTQSKGRFPRVSHQKSSVEKQPLRIIVANRIDAHRHLHDPFQWMEEAATGFQAITGRVPIKPFIR